MQPDHTRERPPREKVLIVAHSDGFLEVFGAKHVDVRIQRCLAAFSPEMEAVAEDCVELSLPPAWRSLYFPGFCRRSAMLRPLLPTTMRDAQQIRDLLRNLNGITGRVA